MSFDFREPSIHRVADMRADCTDVSDFTCMTLTFRDKHGKSAELETYWTGADAMARAHAFVEAINAVTAPLAEVIAFPSDSHLDSIVNDAMNREPA